jgi:hypothetical protein
MILPSIFDAIRKNLLSILFWYAPRGSNSSRPPGTLLNYSNKLIEKIVAICVINTGGAFFPARGQTCWLEGPSFVGVVPVNKGRLSGWRLALKISAFFHKQVRGAVKGRGAKGGSFSNESDPLV